MTKLKVINKDAKIRSPSFRSCPFGLPISVACKNAGNSIDQMQSLDEVSEGQKEKTQKTNRRVYVYHQTGERCAYADKIVEGKDAVHCDYGESGARMSDFPMRPSPFYPRVFHGLGQYGLYSYSLEDYADAHAARQLFTGMYSIYASYDEVNISKNGSYTFNDKDSDLLMKEDTEQDESVTTESEDNK